MKDFMENLVVNDEIDFNFGLDKIQVGERVKNGFANKLLTKTSKSYFKIFIDNICTWFNFVCILMASLLIAVGSFENVTFVIIFLANLLIGLIQEIRAKRVVDNITVLNKSKVKVLRHGRKHNLDKNDVVVDDIIFFEAGEQICADCVVIEGKIEANESLITGEAKPIRKTANATLYGGSFVVSGSCKAQVVKVGKNTYSATLIKKARELKDNQSEILRTLNFIIKTVGLIMIPLGLLTFFDAYDGNNFSEAIVTISGSVIGMMPVGIFLLTSVSLVVSVLKLARKKTLVQELYSIEMLARANVLCLDKTGTITDGTMSVTGVLAINSVYEDIEQIMPNYVNSIDVLNQTQIALKKHFGTKKEWEVKDIIEFSSERKYSAITFKNNGTYVLGAPEFICTKLEKGIQQTIKDFTVNGYRVLLLCKNENEIKKDDIKLKTTPLAIITIQDNIRQDAKETIEWFNENDVEIKIISGDNVDTVSNISKKVGVPNADKCISLDGLTDEEVAKAALKYNIFGRVTPEQKSLIIRTLRENDKVVAMTGDGVNDILAMKEADCSIAMASGSEATRSASDIVMMESNFSSMPDIVAEGRRVINNISKSSSLFLTKTFFTIFLTIFVLISPTFVYPLQANQILIWETVFIGIPAFLLALQPNKNRIKGSFLGSLTSKTLPGALILFLSAMACYIYCGIIGNFEILSTILSYTVTLGAFAILFNLCLPLDMYKAYICFGLLIVCIACFFSLPAEFFGFVTLTTKNKSFIIIVCILIFALYALFKKLCEWLLDLKWMKNMISKSDKALEKDIKNKRKRKTAKK